MSVVLRDYDSDTTHCNGINSMLVVEPEEKMRSGSCNLITGSRDRLIKVWHVEYAKLAASQKQQEVRGVTLLADLDDHSDWVNQIKYVEEVRTLVSCSNDTTIRIWRCKSNEGYESRN